MRWWASLESSLLATFGLKTAVFIRRSMVIRCLKSKMVNAEGNFALKRFGRRRSVAALGQCRGTGLPSAARQPDNRLYETTTTTGEMHAVPDRIGLFGGAGAC